MGSGSPASDRDLRLSVTGPPVLEVECQSRPRQSPGRGLPQLPLIEEPGLDRAPRLFAELPRNEPRNGCLAIAGLPAGRGDVGCEGRQPRARRRTGVLAEDWKQRASELE